MLKYAKKIITIIIAISLIGILPVLSQATSGIIIFEKDYFFLKTKVENTEYFFTEEFKKCLSESDETKHLENLIKSTKILHDGRQSSDDSEFSSFYIILTEERTDLPEIVNLIDKLEKVYTAQIIIHPILGDNYFIGDVDENYKFQAADARLCLRAVVGLEELSPRKLYIADVDRNGIIDATDARIILRMAVGLDP